jgi:hypothetical protein
MSSPVRSPSSAAAAPVPFPPAFVRSARARTASTTSPSVWSMGTCTEGASCSPRVERNVALSGSTQLSSTVTVEPIFAPASVSVLVVDFTRLSSAPGRTTTETVASCSRFARSDLLLASVKASRAWAAFSASSSWARSWVRSSRSLVTSEVRVFPMSSLSGPAPRTMPTARARKIETMETRWYRKSIT